MAASLNEHISNSAEDTFELGKQLALKLMPGSVVALSGNLGSGKTCFTKGIAEGLGITDMITSPTYTIVNEYELNLARHDTELNRIIYHIDTYRLNNEDDFINIGGQEIIYSNNICIIEWSDKIKNLLPDNTITVNIEIIGTDSRKIKIEGITL